MKRSGKERGSTYLEMLAALTLVGFAILLTSGTLIRGRARLGDLDRRARALHALDTEVATLRAQGALDLGPGEYPWFSDPAAGSGIAGAVGSLEIDSGPLPGLLRCRVRLALEGLPPFERELILPVAD